MKIIAVIPCLNEEKFIADVVNRAGKYVDRVIVVDDGSGDKTSQIAQQSGALVMRHAQSMGAGAATRSGIIEAKKLDAGIVITLDGDGQHNTDEIPRLLTAVTRGHADLVIGSRFINPATNIKLHRRLGISTITFLYNFGMKSRTSDAQSGFRAYGSKFLDCVNITENGFGFSIETLVKARSKGLLTLEVPVSCIYHRYAHSINPVIHGIRVCLAVLKWRLKIELLRGKIQ